MIGMIEKTRKIGMRRIRELKRMIGMRGMRRKMLDRGGNQEAGVENRTEIGIEKGRNNGRKKGKTRGGGREGTKIIIDKEKGRLFQFLIII